MSDTDTSIASNSVKIITLPLPPKNRAAPELPQIHTKDSTIQPLIKSDRLPLNDPTHVQAKQSTSTIRLTTEEKLYLMQRCKPLSKYSVAFNRDTSCPPPKSAQGIPDDSIVNMQTDADEKEEVDSYMRELSFMMSDLVMGESLIAKGYMPYCQ
ncbi:uncharacterized protein VTP21DRAFT_10016 [Calcarisporiella thermophila]|uniref:uncharacterized protein n=1 Tax=Calcarisporiella thermophila TaxID=911321 RepID=UPI0037438228